MPLAPRASQEAPLALVIAAQLVTLSTATRHQRPALPALIQIVPTAILTLMYVKFATPTTMLTLPIAPAGAPVVSSPIRALAFLPVQHPIGEIQLHALARLATHSVEAVPVLR
jgi:hypothetical protein